MSIHDTVNRLVADALSDVVDDHPSKVKFFLEINEADSLRSCTANDR
jgi:hypothetical protein